MTASPRSRTSTAPAQAKKSSDRVNGPVLPALTPVLERARSIGFLGPGPVEDHVEHAGLFRQALDNLGARGGAGGPGHEGFVGRAVDIGAGGGVPGLVLLATMPSLDLVLLDAAQKRCAFLVWAVAELGVSDRAEVWCGRAEEIGHEERARESFDAVVARGFGPPASTLECAAALVRPGGHVVISEPPTPRRWPTDGLAELALDRGPSAEAMAVFVRRDGLDDQYPRSARHQQRRPTFDLE